MKIKRRCPKKENCFFTDSGESDTETVGWGTDYTLERFTENGWEMIENSAAALETQKETQQAEGSQAVAGETKEGTLDLAADGIRLEAGQYRLKKNAGFLTTKTTARRS